MAEFDGFEFIVTEEDDVMLVIYARSGNPENSVAELNLSEKKVILYRNKSDIITLEDVPENVLENLKEETVLLITEVVPTDNPLEQEIKQVYEARIVH